MTRITILWLGLALMIPTQARDWNEVESFAYQLQNADLEELAKSPYDLLILDYSLDGSHQQRLTREQVAHLQSGGRLVVAYLSIGEAEDYRYYWDPKAPYLRAVNPEWEGNYPVEFWQPEWQAVMLDYLDHIVAAGFDGVYLDLVDVYEQFQEDRPEARQDMIELVQTLAKRARQQAGADFGVFPQNAEELLTEPSYRATITGIGKEDTYFGYPNTGEPSDPAWTRQVEELLSLAQQDGKLVLNIDYPGSPEQARLAHRKANQRGYLEYAAQRDLASLELAANPVEEPGFNWTLLVGLGLPTLMVTGKVFYSWWETYRS